MHLGNLKHKLGGILKHTLGEILKHALGEQYENEVLYRTNVKTQRLSCKSEGGTCNLNYENGKQCL